MDIEKAKKELLSNVTLAGGYEPPISKAIQTVLNELDKKDKIINEMAVTLYEYANLGKLGICPAELEDGIYNLDLCKMTLAKRSCAICVIDYFTKKVSE